MRSNPKFERIASFTAQFVFQHVVGTETAILKTFQYTRKELKYAAVLDVIAAYDKLPREKHIQILRERLRSQLVSRILPFLATNWEKARDDENMSKNTVT